MRSVLPFVASAVAGAVLAVYALDWIVRFESDELGKRGPHA